MSAREPIRDANLSFSGSRLNIMTPFELRDPGIGKDDHLIFLHPPKTAGTNISFFMTAVNSVDSSVGIKRFAVPRVEGQSPNFIYDGWCGGLEAAKIALAAQPRVCDTFNFISGHMPLGLHEMAEIDAKYMMLVRDPIEREISAMNFDYQRAYITAEESMEYLTNRMLDNPQTRILAGAEYMTGPCTAATFDAALRNIEKLCLFIAPHNASFNVIRALADIYGAPATAIAKAQVTGITLIEQPDENLVRFLERKHAFDIMLHDYAERVWTHWMQTHVIGQKTIAPDDDVTVLGPEFANTKTPVFMKLSEVAGYNDSVPDMLLNVSQNHSEVDARAGEGTMFIRPDRKRLG